MSKTRQLWLYGLHPCAAALKNPQRKLLELVYAHPKNLEKLTSSSGLDFSQPTRLPYKLRMAEKNWFDSKFGEDSVHQGVALLVYSLQTFTIEDLAEDSSQNQLIVVLDQVNDPHNVGAIIRSAAAFEAKAIVMTNRNAPDESPILAKSASGALEIIPIMRYANLSNALQDLKKAGFWVYGFSEQGSTPLGKISFSGKIALVLGAEGTGMRALTKKCCDFLVHIETSPKFSTLNVSNAAAVALSHVYSDFHSL